MVPSQQVPPCESRSALADEGLLFGICPMGSASVCDARGNQGGSGWILGLLQGARTRTHMALQMLGALERSGTVVARVGYDPTPASRALWPLHVVAHVGQHYGCKCACWRSLNWRELGADNIWLHKIPPPFCWGRENGEIRKSTG